MKEFLELINKVNTNIKWITYKKADKVKAIFIKAVDKKYIYLLHKDDQYVFAFWTRNSFSPLSDAEVSEMIEINDLKQALVLNIENRIVKLNERTQKLYSVYNTILTN